MQLEKVNKKFLLVILGVLALLSVLVPVNAESGFLRCYNRKLDHEDIDCSLCDNLDTDVIQDRRTSTGFNQCGADEVFDKATCTCPKKSGDCSSFTDRDALETKAAECYNSGKFWNDNYCDCTDDSIGVIETYDPTTAYTDRSFFSVNFDGRIEDIPEMIRFGILAVFGVIGTTAMFIGLYGMYVYSTASGDNDEQIQKGQQILKNGLVGLAIAILGIALIQFIAFMFGVSADELFVFDFQ